MFRLEMLPAAHGDCLWIEYGHDDTIHRLLIDGGPAHTYPRLRERILHLPSGQRHFDLLVITHIDADHIEGIIRLLLDAESLGCRFDRIWFNGSPQLGAVPDPAGDALGGVQGEILGLLIAEYEARTASQVWNRDFAGGIAAIDPGQPKLPVVMLPEDCRLTLLSPDHQRLQELKDSWQDELRSARLTSGDAAQLRTFLANSRTLRPMGDVLGSEEDALLTASEPDDSGPWPDLLGGGEEARGAFGSDTSPANGSSIALLLEYPAENPEACFLLCGDAWPSVLQSSLERLLPNKANARLQVDGCKLPHHGSVANISESLLARLRCTHYLISTNGAIFGHPHARAIELLLTSHQGAGQARLHFNYLTPTTQAWSDTADQKARRYQAFHPAGLSLTL